MTYFEKKIEKKVLYESNQYFPSHTNKKGNIIKIANEPYSYWIDKTKMYIFEDNELFNFLTWYWYNYTESFIFDFCNIDYEIPWKYFSDIVTNFKYNYPNLESYNTNIIQQPNLVSIYNNLINVNGINDFINNVIFKNNNYKLMDFKKINNVIYKFATDSGTQIFK